MPLAFDPLRRPLKQSHHTNGQTFFVLAENTNRKFHDWFFYANAVLQLRHGSVNVDGNAEMLNPTQTKGQEPLSSVGCPKGQGKALWTAVSRYAGVFSLGNMPHPVVDSSLTSWTSQVGRRLQVQEASNTKRTVPNLLLSLLLIYTAHMQTSQLLICI